MLVLGKLLLLVLVLSVCSKVSTNLRHRRMFNLANQTKTDACQNQERFPSKNKAKRRSIAEINQQMLILNPLAKGLYPEPYEVLVDEEIFIPGFPNDFAVFDIVTSFQNYFPDANRVQLLNLLNQNQQALTIVDVTVDLRNLNTLKNIQNKNIQSQFTFERDWDLGIIIQQNITLDDIQQKSTDLNIVFPDFFGRNDTDKVDSHRFRLFFWAQNQMTIVARIQNLTYINQRISFFNSTAVTFLEFANKGNIFAAVIQNDGSVNLPVVVPPLNQDGSYPSYLITYLQNSQQLMPANIIPRVNSFTPNSLYWRDRSEIFLPYIPFFSNCRSFGEHFYLFKQIRDEKKCTIVPVEDVYSIYPFQFGDKPKSDFCQDLEYECVLDEVKNDLQNLPRWFQLKVDDNIFYLTKLEIPFTTDDLNSMVLDANSIVPVTVSLNQVPFNKFPQKIILTINYYQMSKTEQKIVKANFYFTSFLEMTEKQNRRQEPFNYTMNFNFHSMTHTELVLAFALEWQVYFVLYIGLGIMAIIQIAIFFVYKYITNRQRPRPEVRFKAYLIPVYPDIYRGVALSMIPLAVGLCLIQIIMTGNFWDYPLPYDNGCILGNACMMSFFDQFNNNYALDSSDIIGLRSGRTGLAMSVFGFYVMIRISGVLIPEKTKEKETGEQISKQNLMEVILVSQGHDGNIWESVVWRRSFFLFHGMIILILMLILIQFSFSTQYAVNAWGYMGFLKVAQIIIEFIVEESIEDHLTFHPLSCVFTVCSSLSGMGAANFFDFLFSYFIDVGIVICERCYVFKGEDFFKDHIKEGVIILRKYIQKVFAEDEDQDDDDQEEQGGEQLEEQEQQQKEDEAENKQEQNSMEADENQMNQIKDNQIIDEVDEDGSNIILTQEEKDFVFIDYYDLDNNDLHEKQNQLNQQQTQFISPKKADAFNDEEDIYEMIFQEKLHDLYQKQQKQNNEKEMNKNQNNSKNTESLQGTLSGDNQEEEEEIPDYSDAVDRWIDYSNDSTINLITPMMMLMTWLFYDENNLAADYGITQNDFIFYLLFSTCIIPFQTVIDIFFFNILNQYHDVDFYDYLLHQKERFQNRTLRWKVSDEDCASQYVDEEFHRIDHWCFSSQYYFTISLYISGQTILTIGLHTIIKQNYNCFSDDALPLIITLVAFMCVLIDKLSIFFGNQLKIWLLKHPDDAKVSPSEDLQTERDLIDQTNLTSSKMKTDNQLGTGLQNVISWNAAINTKENNERINEIILLFEQQEFQDEPFNLKYIRKHQDWIRENIHLIFNSLFREIKVGQNQNDSDESFNLALEEKQKALKHLGKQTITQKQYINLRKMTLQTFKNIYGSIEKNIPQEEQNVQNENPQKQIQMIQAKNQGNIKMTPHLEAIMQIWLYRSRHLKRAQNLVGGLLEKETKNYCEFCCNIWGLRCEPEQSIEDLFSAFLHIMSKEKPGLKDIKHYKQIDRWQDYFIQNCTFVTLCFSCNEQTVDNLQEINQKTESQWKRDYDEKEQINEEQKSDEEGNHKKQGGEIHDREDGLNYQLEEDKLDREENEPFNRSHPFKNHGNSQEYTLSLNRDNDGGMGVISPQDLLVHSDLSSTYVKYKQLIRQESRSLHETPNQGNIDVNYLDQISQQSQSIHTGQDLVKKKFTEISEQDHSIISSEKDKSQLDLMNNGQEKRVFQNYDVVEVGPKNSNNFSINSNKIQRQQTNE